MKVKATLAKAISKVALKTAKASCGAASFFGPYQPKEPANIKKLLK